MTLEDIKDTEIKKIDNEIFAIKNIQLCIDETLNIKKARELLDSVLDFARELSYIIKE